MSLFKKLPPLISWTGSVPCDSSFLYILVALVKWYLVFSLLLLGLLLPPIIQKATIMDFERIKQNLKFRSGKSGRRSKKRGPDKNDYYEDYRSPSSSNGVYLGVNNKDVAYSDNISALPSLPNDGPNIDNPAFSLTSPNDSNTPAHPHQKSITNPSKARTWSRKHRGDNSKSDGQGGTGASTGEHNFDLRAPMPNVPSITLEKLSELLFSHEHLQTILQEPKLFAKFTAFLNSYRPHNAPVLVRYLETAKALKAIEYANAIAASMKQLDGEQDSYNFPLTAANAVSLSPLTAFD